MKLGMTTEVGIYLLTEMFIIFSHNGLINTIAAFILHPNPSKYKRYYLLPHFLDKFIKFPAFLAPPPAPAPTPSPLSLFSSSAPSVPPPPPFIPTPLFVFYFFFIFLLFSIFSYYFYLILLINKMNYLIFY